MIEVEHLIIFLFGSVVFCWLAVAMAMANNPKQDFEVSNPRAQARFAFIIYFLLFVISFAYKYLLPRITFAAPEAADTIFAAATIFLVIAAALRFGDTLSSIGLSLRYAYTAALFLLPPLAIALFPGGAVNWKLIIRGTTLFIILIAFTEELLFRGYLQTRFQAAWGFWPGLLAMAATASLFHLPMMIFVAQPQAIITKMILQFIIWGCLAGLIFKRTGNIYGLVILRIFWHTAIQTFAGFTIE